MGRGPKTFGGRSKTLLGGDLSSFARANLTPAAQVKIYDAAGRIKKVTSRKKVIANQRRQRAKVYAAWKKKNYKAILCATTHAFFKRGKVQKQMKVDDNSVALANFEAAMADQAAAKGKG